MLQMVIVTTSLLILDVPLYTSLRTPENAIPPMYSPQSKNDNFAIPPFIVKDPPIPRFINMSASTNSPTHVYPTPPTPSKPSAINTFPPSIVPPAALPPEKPRANIRSKRQKPDIPFPFNDGDAHRTDMFFSELRALVALQVVRSR